VSVEAPFHVRHYTLDINRMVEPVLNSEHVAWEWVRTH
jgi:hypothetical protein